MRTPDQAPGAGHATHPIEIVHDGWRLGADNADEILTPLIDGYADLGDAPARLQARVRLAGEARTLVQSLLNAGEPFDLCTAEEQRILLDRTDAPPQISEWECAVPLVLVTVFYQPVGALPQPRVAAPGQVWWIDPSTASSLLASLHQLRWLDLVRVDTLDRPASKAYRNLGTNGAAGYWWRSVPA